MTGFHFRQLSLEGVWLVHSTPAVDERGSFARLWCADEAAKHNLPTAIAQISHSVNPHPLTLRGMHFQTAPHEESKWVRCIAGEIHDVLLDVRPHSPTFGKWEAVRLSPRDLSQLYIPPGIAHGFLTLQPNSVVLYAITEFYHPTAARGVRWNDPEFAIKWPEKPQTISSRDANYPPWNESYTSLISTNATANA